MVSILRASIDDAMMLSMIEPMLLSLSDDELHGYLVKVKQILDDVLLTGSQPNQSKAASGLAGN